VQHYDRDEQENPAPKYDPAGETKQKIVFAVIAVVILVVLKLLGGF